MKTSSKTKITLIFGSNFLVNRKFGTQLEILIGSEEKVCAK